MIRTAMKQAPKSNVRWLIAACAAALFALQAEPSWAAQYAGALPWDQTLGAIQDILVGPVAHAVIALNFSLCRRSFTRSAATGKQGACWLADWQLAPR